MGKDVYLKGIEYASEHDEVELFRESLRSNRDCVSAIKEEIRNKTTYLEYGKTVDLPKALDDIMAQGHSIDRVAFVTAATVYISSYDGRYDNEVKNWAAAQFAELPQSVCDKARDNAIHDNDGTCHPVILNSFAHKVIKQQALSRQEVKSEKTSIMERAASAQERSKTTATDGPDKAKRL